MTQVVMLVTQNQDTTQSIEKHIQKQFPLATISFHLVEEAFKHLATPSALQPDVVFFELNDAYSLEVIARMRKLRRDLQIIALVSHVHTELGVKALGVGASDFLMMPFHYAQLLAVIPNAIRRRDLQILVRNAGFGERISLKDMEAESAALSAVLFIANQLMESDSHIVVEGATGTGREMLARAIHGSCPRRYFPFFVVNAASYSAEELYHYCFDWEQGIFAQVERGTVFLRNAQKLGRNFHAALESIVTRGFVGKKGVTPFEGRLVFAVGDASAYADKEYADMQHYLFAKINALSVRMPTLSEMKEDIPQLAMLLCRHYAAVEGKLVLSMTEEVKKMLREYIWPGNFEQLSQVMFNAVMQARGTQLQVDNFRHFIEGDSAHVIALDKAGAGDDGQPKPLLSCVDQTGKVRKLKDVEQDMIQFALKRYSGHMSDVAKHLGIGRSTLYRKISNRGSKGH